MNNQNLIPKILHVDDNEDFLSIFHLNYRNWFDITSVESGEKALDLLADKYFDVIITDYDMPEMNGLELLTAIKRKKIPTPVIFYTGQGSEEIARQAFISGVSDYFTKELNAFAHKDKILNSIYRAIEIESANREKRESTWRIIRQQKFVLDIATSGSMAAGNLEDLFRTITGKASDILGVQKVSIWFFDENESVLRNAAHYDSTTGTHSNDLILKASDYPKYFSLLKELRVMNVWDVLTDPRMTEFVGTFNQPGEIVSLLVASIRVSGQFMGTFVIEQIGKNRKWTPDEVAFVGEIADQVAHAIINSQNRKAEDRERHLIAVLRAIRNVNQIITKVSNREDLLSQSCENLVENLGFQKACIKILNETGELERVFYSGTINTSPIQSGNNADNNRLFSYEKETLIRNELVRKKQGKGETGEYPFIGDDESVTIMSYRLKHSEKIYGVLTVAVLPEIATDSEMQALFMEVADDISFALSKIEMEETREKTEKILFELEERYEMAIKGAGLGVWDWDIPTGKVIFNERWAEMLGYDIQEIAPDFISWANLVHPDDLPYAKKVLNDHIEGKTDFYKTEHRMKSKSGEWVWILDCGKVFKRDEDGKPLRAIGIHLDINDLKKTEKALEESELKYRILFEHANDAIFVIKDLRIIQCNKKTEELFGANSEKIIGKTPMDLSPPYQPDGRDSTEKAEEVINNALRGEPQIFEWIHNRIDGTLFHSEISLKAMNLNGEDRLLCIGRDISNRNNVEPETT